MMYSTIFSRYSTKNMGFAVSFKFLPQSSFSSGSSIFTSHSLPLLADSLRPKLHRRKINSQRFLAHFLVERHACNRAHCSKVKAEDDITDEACELVNGVEVSIGEGENSIRAFLFSAVKNNNGTGILLLSDIFGFEDSATRDFAYRVACNGYNVLVPDLFRGDPWTKERSMSVFEQWLSNHKRERVAKDIFTSSMWMAEEFLAAGISKKLGLIGFCFGGGLVVDILAQDQGASFASGISFYGTRIDPNIAVNIQIPVLFVVGDNDPLCPVGLVRGIEAKGEKSKVVVFKDRGHGFAHRPQSLEEDADAEEAFMIMRNWLDDGLFVET